MTTAAATTATTATLTDFAPSAALEPTTTAVTIAIGSRLSLRPHKIGMRPFFKEFRNWTALETAKKTNPCLNDNLPSAAQSAHNDITYEPHIATPALLPQSNN